MAAPEQPREGVVIVVTRARDQAGEVIAVVVVVLDLDWLQGLTSTFQSLPEENITVLDRGGTVLARAPEAG